MEIINLESTQGQKSRLTDQLGIALTHNYADLDQLITEELLIEGFVVVFAESGRASFTIGDEECKVEAGEMLIANYGQRISNMLISANIAFRAFFLSREFVESLVVRLGINWSLRSGIFYFSFVKLRLNQEEQTNVCLYYDLLDRKRQQTRHQQQGIDALCEAFGYEMLDIMEQHGFLKDEEGASLSNMHDAAHQHFDAFMQLLVNADVVDRVVTHYADQLHISSKYLNLICQQVAQTNPSDLIEKELLQRAIRLLRESPLSIKQIAHQLGFANQSHFGTYMRRISGKSPQQLRGENAVMLEPIVGLK